MEQSSKGRAARALAAALAALAAGAPLSGRAQQSAQGDTGIDEVVITARKHRENLQDAPLAISAIGGSQIEALALQDLSQAARLVPNLSLKKAGPYAGGSAAAAVFVRGVGQMDFLLPADPGVGVYVDGVYQARMVGAALDLDDIERVEVLRGPQGTLFGRNAIGGAISVVTNRPQPEYSSYASVTAGENAHYAFKGALNVPLSEQFSMRLSGQRRTRGGYVDLLQYSDHNGGEEDSLALRQQLRFQRDRFDSVLALDFRREREPFGPWVAEQIRAVGEDPDYDFLFASLANDNTMDPSCKTVEGQSTNPACFGPVHEAGKFKTNNAFYDAQTGKRITPKNEAKSYGVAWTNDVELWPSTTLKLISSYHKLDSTFDTSLSHTPLKVFSANTPRFDSDQYSQELQLVGSALGTRLDWVTGLFVFHEDGLQTEGFATSAFDRADTRIEVKNDSRALFGSATLHITERLHATLGERWTGDIKHGRLEVPNFIDPISTDPAPTFLDASRRSRAHTPSASLSFDLARDVMSYVSYAKGYRSGSFTTRLPFPNLGTGITTSKPETLTTVEVGLKSSLFDDRMRLNLAAFQSGYDRIQITYEPDTSPPTSPLVGNLGEARMRGIELELQALLGERLTLSGSLGLLDARYTDLSPRPTRFWSKHTPMLRAPHYQGNLALAYHFPLPSGASIALGMDWSLVGKEALDPEAAGFPYAVEGAWNSGNASLGYVAPGEKWGLTLHVQNVTDETHRIGSLDATREGWGVAESAYNRPREAFVTLDYRF